MAIATSHVPLDIIHPVICAFIIGFGCTTACTKLWSLAGSIADGMLDDAILVLPRPPILSTNIEKLKGSSKKYGNY